MAARAGTAGKGFAAVADEVRNLVGKSAEASQDMEGLFESAIHAVENGTFIVQETAKSLGRVVNESKEVANTVDKISDAAREQAIACPYDIKPLRGDTRSSQR